MPEPIAIVGMAAVFPGAPTLEVFWSNLERGVDAITDVPADRLDHAFRDAFACKRGGFIAPTFDPVAFGIMPVAAKGAEPDQLLALHVAAAALADAGNEIERERAGVILGRGAYLTPGMARLANRVRMSEQLATTLRELLPELGADTVDKIRAAFRASAGEVGPEAAIGLVPNLAASRIANRLDLRGPAYTIDAACASSLLAIDHGCRELADRRCDVVVAGGVHVCHDVTFWSVFSELGALSKTSTIRPFDRRADGIVIGEGAGVVVMKRLADAERAGDRIYAVILGTGVSSDGRESSAMRPRADGQLAAIDAAWRAADRDPSTVGLVEAHGTATPTGDDVELAALAQFFGAATGQRTPLGSIKSMIGHAMPAAGAAGLIKTALAIHHGVTPPSLHCEEPNEALARTRFRVPAIAEPWDAPQRRAGVSAFGFGGINAHVVLESHASAPRRSRKQPPSSRLLAIAGDSIAALHAALDANGSSSSGTFRLALLDPTPERRAIAHKVLDRGTPWRGNKDIWFSPRGLAADGGKLAFVFPGIEATFAANLDELPAANSIANAIGATEIEARGRGVFGLGRILFDAMTRLGAKPDAIAGHSMGEWTGMVASEMIPRDAVDAFLDELPPSLDVPEVVFAAIGCSADGARAALEGLDAIAVSHDNCPHQSILCGRRDRVLVAIDRLGQRGVLCQELPFRSGFHSPLFADFIAPHRARIATLALQRPRVPLWSATTCVPYPDDPAAIRALAIDHLVEPVRFRELIENLHAHGVCAFVQLGVGSVVGFVDDTLRGRDHLAIAAASQHAGQMTRVAAALWVEGFTERDKGTVPLSRSQTERDKGTVPLSGSRGMKLELGVPLVRLAGHVAPLRAHTGQAAPLDVRAHTGLAAPLDVRAHTRRDIGDIGGRDFDGHNVDDPVIAELLATLDDAAAASRAVVDAYRAKSQPDMSSACDGVGPLFSKTATSMSRSSESRTDETASSGVRAVRRRLSVDDVPALVDHCFYRQPADAPMSDRYPVVPMTMTIAVLIDAANRLAPQCVAIAVEDVRAYRWLAVAPAIDVEVTARLRDPARVDVERAESDDRISPNQLGRMPIGYRPNQVGSSDASRSNDTSKVSGGSTSRFLDTRARRSCSRTAIRGRHHRRSPRSRMRGRRRSTHGGCTTTAGCSMARSIKAWSSSDLSATTASTDQIEVLPAPGALLDCAGQLMGWWVMHTEKCDRLAMPVKIDRIALFAPEPKPGERVGCRVRMRHIGERDVRADLELVTGDRVWARIDGWEDRRFDSDDPVWAVLMYPERNVLAVPVDEYVVVTEHWRAAASRELMMRRYLGERERDAHERIGPRGRRGWLLGRIAIKDAVRLYRWRHGAGPMFPVEVEVGNESSGRPITSVEDLHVSVAHKDDRAVAIVGERPVGIDLERIEPRTETFAAIAFTARELALGDSDEWPTRLWAAKEAAAKAQGTGLTDPKRFEVTARDGERLFIGDRAIATRRDGDYIIAWTCT